MSVVKNRFFGAPEPHSGLQNWKCPIIFLKICLKALQSGIKIWVFIESSWFLIPDNIQDLSNHIFEKYSERSPKRSPPVLSKFEIFKIWSDFSEFSNDFRRLQNSITGLRFGAPKFLEFKNMNCQHSLEQNCQHSLEQKSSWFDKNSCFYPALKCPNADFQKSDRALSILELGMRLRSVILYNAYVHEKLKNFLCQLWPYFFVPVNVDNSYF